MGSETGNLQNEFFNTARKDGTQVTVFLGNGTKLVGRIKGFDKFTLLLDGPQGEQMVFKHAISTVSTVPAGDRRATNPHEGASAGAPGRLRQT